MPYILYCGDILKDKHAGLGDYTPREVIKVLRRYSKGRLVRDEDVTLLEILSSMNLIRFGRGRKENARTAITTDTGCLFAGW